MKQSEAVPTSRLAVVLARAYRSLSDFFERKLARQGISLIDFAILEALLHKGPLTGSAVASKTGTEPNAVDQAVIRLIRRGLIRRVNGSRGAVGLCELTQDGRSRITETYERHKRDLEAIFGSLSPTERKRLWHVLKRIGSEADRGRRALSHNHRGGLAQWQLRRVAEYMIQRVDDAVPLKELAAQAGLSPSQFRRAFKASMGIPPHRWQTQLRVLQAQELLRESDLSLAEISLATGFAEQSHFSRVFKGLVGVSPGAWQRENR